MKNKKIKQIPPATLDITAVYTVKKIIFLLLFLFLWGIIGPTLIITICPELC